MECTDSNVSIDKTSKNKVSAVGANSLYIRKPCTIFFYEKVVKWCNNINFAVFHVIPPIVNPIFMQLVPHQLCFPVILLSDAFPHQPLLYV